MLFSAFNALTLSPALSAKLLKSGGKKSPLDFFYRRFNKVFDRFTSGYVKFTGTLVRRPIPGLLFIAGLIVVLVLLFRVVPMGFVPEEDNGYFLVVAQLPDASSLERTDKVCRKVESILGEMHGIDNYTTVVGMNIVTNTVGPNTASVFVSLKPWHERHGTENRSFEMIAALNRRLSC